MVTVGGRGGGGQNDPARSFWGRRVAGLPLGTHPNDPATSL